MEVITIESRAFQEILENLKSLCEYVEQQQGKVNIDDAWVDSDDVCSYLQISQRTLQRLRTRGEITYSTLGGKTYYTISEIKRVLEERKVRSSQQSIDELSQQYKERFSKTKEK